MKRESWVPQWRDPIRITRFIWEMCITSAITTEVRENFLGEKTSPYTPVKVADGAQGSFALNGNHEMYADGNGYWRMVLPRMGLERARREMGSRAVGELLLPRKHTLAHHWIGHGLQLYSVRLRELPLLQRSRWLRKTTLFKPDCAIPDPLLAWLQGAVNPDGDKRGLIYCRITGRIRVRVLVSNPGAQLAKLIPGR